MFLDYDIGDDSYYLFTCAELKAREIEFLGKDKIERMLKSKSMEDFLSVLRDTVYSGYISDMERSRSFENAILEEYKGMVEFLSERLRPEHQIVKDLLFFEQNIHNLKVIVKSVIMDMDLEDLFIPLFYSYGELKDAAVTENYEKIDKSVSEILKFSVELAKGQKNYRLMELELERFYLKEIFNSVKELGSRLITDYLRHVIDIMNIKNFYRNKYLEEDLDFDYFLHENGFLQKEMIMEFKDESLDLFIREMGRTAYADIAVKGSHALQYEGTFSSFEKNEDSFYIDFFDSLKYTVSNLENVFKFFLLKKMELSYLNVIFTGVRYGVGENIIRSKVGV